MDNLLTNFVDRILSLKSKGEVVATVGELHLQVSGDSYEEARKRMLVEICCELRDRSAAGKS
jgi:hypothetical protein